MRVFVTGATGFVGAAVVQELLGAGHQVLGLASSAAAAQALLALGAEVQRGSLANRDSWRRGVEAADGVIHPAGPFGIASNPAQAAANRTAVKSLGAVLAGSDRPLVIAATLPIRLTREGGRSLAGYLNPCPTVEKIVAEGARVSVVRLPPVVYGDGVEAFVPQLTRACATGPLGYLRAGTLPWLAVHRREAALLFRLVLEQAAAWPLSTPWPAVSTGVGCAFNSR